MSSIALLQFIVAASLPVIAAVLFYQLDKNTRFSSLPYVAKQAIYGIVFGCIAIFGTEFGIDTHDATMNVRDAAPLVAGLLFGGPAGIISGVIGGVERWFSVLWGRGMFTRLACSVATVASGVYAALLRRFMFEGKKPTWPFGLSIGTVAEVLHLTLIFITNTDHIVKAFLVVRACTVPMLAFNALSVAAATLAVTLLSGERLRRSPDQREITDSVQNGMLAATVLALIVTYVFTRSVQVNLANAETREQLMVAATDAGTDINEFTRTARPDANLDSLARGITMNWHVGVGGSLVVANSQGVVLSTIDSAGGQSLGELGLSAGVADNPPDTVYRQNLGRESYYCLYRTFGSFIVIAMVPVNDADFFLRASLLLSAYMEIIIFAALFSVIYSLIKRLVVDNIRKVNGALAKITEGDLDLSVDVRANREFASLSDDINSTVGALKHAIADAAARIDAELEYARTIQRSALPRFFPPYPQRHDFEIFATMDAAKEVGGDFYDFYLIDDDHLAFMVADVSGKGIPAAMFMMTAKTLLKSLAEAGVPVEDVLTHGNDELCATNDAEMFVTVWMGILDVRTGHVTYANAGHNPPCLGRAGESFSYVHVRPNMVLAAVEGIRYRRHELDLEPGDVLFLYTDGVTEATDANDELFGEERLLATLNAHATEDVTTLCHAVHAAVDEFVGTAPQFDDITMLALRYQGGEWDHVSHDCR